MNSKTEASGSGLDTLKLATVAVMLVAGVGAFYYFGDQSPLLRVSGLLAVVVVAAFVAYQTALGRSVWRYLRESRNEVRKVVWPTRAETMQTTLIVVVMVIVVGILLGLLDMFLGWAVRLLTGQGG